MRQFAGRFLSVSLLGGRFILLDAKTPELAKWYSRHGFLALKDSECRMILPMKDVPSLLGESGLL